MDKPVRIKIPKSKKYIHGKIRGSLRKPCIVLVHGLTGHMDKPLVRGAAEWFPSHGFSTIRISLYHYAKDARSLTDTTLKINAHDIDTVTKYLRNRSCERIFLVGHSYSGPAVLMANQSRVDGAALWDPSYENSFKRSKYGSPAGKYLPSIKSYRMQWGTDYLIGKKMADEAESLDWSALSSKWFKALLIVCAGNGPLKKGCRQYYQKASGQRKLVTIAGAGHAFDDSDQIRDRLFRETAAWFKKVK